MNNPLRRSPRQSPVNSPEFLRTFVFDRAPTSADWRNFQVRDLWIQRNPGATPPYGYFVLVDKPAQSAVWLRLGSSESGDITQLTPDFGTVVTPDGAGNINIVGGTDITTTGAGSTLTIDSTAAGFIWTTDTTSPINIVSDKEGHIANGAGQIVYNLPAVCTIGENWVFIDRGGNGFQLQAAGGQTIRFGDQITSSGGTFTSKAIGDVIFLYCTVDNTQFTAYAAQGNFDLSGVTSSQNAINNTAEILDVDNINIDGNTIRATNTNGDILLVADGTGEVNATPTLTTTNFNSDNINIDGNTISSTDTNGDINISPNGTGSVVVNTDLDVDNINIDGNTISSTDTDGDINLSPNGTGSVVVNTDLDVDNINIDGNTISSTDTNGNIILTPDGTGEISVTSAPIVPSTDRVDSLGSATNSWNNVYANAVTFDDGTNLLDTYTEDTSFTPNLAFGGGTTGITYAVQTGTYYEIGKLVFIIIELDLTSQGTSIGNATIQGLPFTSQRDALVPIRWSNINLTPAASRNIIGSIGTGVTEIELVMCADNNPFIAATDTNFGNTSAIFLSAVYARQ